MTDFYFTFGDNHGANRNGYIKITAPSVQDARTAMFQIHGNKWAFCYSEEDFIGNNTVILFDKGEMAHYTFEGGSDQRTYPVLVYANGYIPPEDAIYELGENR